MMPGDERRRAGGPGDIELLDGIESQTGRGDKRGLLALHAAVAARGPFAYLEIGSHLGGSLQALVADPRCRQITSIDPRPLVQPDERPEIGYRWRYVDNSTERMLSLLAAVPGADLTKLTTLEHSTEDLDPAALPERPDLCFIDGEHTNAAALRDGEFCIAAIRGRGVIVFHDDGVVEAGIRAFLTRCPPDTVGYLVPNDLFVAELGPVGLLGAPPVGRPLGAGPAAR